MSSPIRVLITGAAGQIGYSLIPLVASGQVFGPQQPVILHLLDIAPMAGVLKGVVMEIKDCAYPLLHSVVDTTDESVAFKDIDSAFLVGSMPRREGMERKELLAANGKIFVSQGRALAAHSKPTVKVLVVGNPANTNALIASKYASPTVPVTNFSAMTRLDHNRAINLFADNHNCGAKEVSRVIIWGNHSSTQFPDFSNVLIRGQTVPFNGHEDAVIEQIQKRGAAVIAARKLSSAMSAAKAAADHMKDWWNGTSEWVSMGVMSDGTKYNAPEGVIFSFPVTIDSKTKEWKIVDNITLDDIAKQRLKLTGNELVEERTDAFASIK